METKAAMLGLDTKTGKKKKESEDKVDTVAEAQAEANKQSTVIGSLVARAYPAYVQARRDGLGAEVAALQAVNQTVSDPSFRAPVLAHFKKYLAVYDAAAVKGGAVVTTSAGGAAGERTRRALLRNRIRQAQRRMAESQARARAVQQQQALLAQQMQQNQAAQAAAASAAERQRLNAMYQQMLAAQQAQQAQYQQAMVSYQQQAQAVQQAQTEERSGAFQAFPYSSDLQPTSATPEFEPAEDASFEASEESEGSEGAEGEESEDLESGEETPFYKKPLFLVVAVIGGFAAYNQYRNKNKSKAPA
jgi:hypothetical protein